MKTILLYKGAKYLCIAATLPATAVVTHKNSAWIDQQVRKVHRPAPVRKPPVRVAYKPQERTGIVATSLPTAEAISTPPVAALCPPSGLSGGGGGSGGTGSGSGGYIGIGGAPISIGHTPEPVVTSPIPEPATWASLILGMVAIGGNIRVARRKAKA